MSEKNKIIKLAQNNIKMRLFLFLKLPLAFIAGLKIVFISPEKAVVTIPYKFLTKNPFRSIYFAALSMAAELSTGILSLAAIAETKKPISMLVLDMKASFTKKAVSKISFTCLEGQKITDAVQACLNSDEGQTVAVQSIGIDKKGNEVAEFEFVWTFKKKN
ncbi:MAG: DUF4442 domain-containing protein [Bacteroidales bacterium]|nr:DUF4442 domain-containing protein [Bacteroidales bacterium]